MPDGTDSSGPAVTIIMGAAGKRPARIEVTSAAAASEVLKEMADIDGPFEDDAIREFIECIEDRHLRSIIDRDLREINVCSKNNAYKSVLLLCGGVIEAFIYQLLSSRRDEAKRYFDDLKRNIEPRKVGIEIEKWYLGDMLAVSEHLDLINHHFYGKARDITEYRNIIHPSYEIRNQITQIDRLAPISIELVKMLILAEGEPGEPSAEA
jgi:hypothetical protein